MLQVVETTTVIMRAIDVLRRVACHVPFKRRIISHLSSEKLILEDFQALRYQTEPTAWGIEPAEPRPFENPAAKRVCEIFPPALYYLLWIGDNPFRRLARTRTPASAFASEKNCNRL